MDTGDALIGGGALGDKTKGEVIIAGMNLMAYDAMALGPKELSLGPDLLRQRMKEASFPLLSANVVLSGTEELVARPYVILERGGHRLGVIGLTRALDRPLAGFQVLDPQQAAARYVPEVGRQADVVILLTNLPYPTALSLADAVPGIDLVVAALPGQLPRQVGRAPTTGTLAVTAEQPVAKHTGRQVGCLVVTVGADGGLSLVSWEIRPMDRQIADDPQMKALLSKYR